MSSNPTPLAYRTTASENPSLGFTLLPGTPADIPTLAKITADASTPDLLCRLFWPTIEVFRKNMEAGLREGLRNPDSETILTKAVSADGEIMGYIGIVIIPKDSGRHEDVQERKSPLLWAITGTREEKDKREFPAKDGFREYFIAKERSISRSWFMNKRVLTVRGLYTHPKFQRRGVGTALMKWANELANKEGIPAILQATPYGYPVYLTVGYKVIEEYDIDLEKWALPGQEGFGWGKYRLRFMLRLAEV